MNMMNFEDNELKETSKTNSHLPLIFVALAISEPMMFIDEFIHGFLNQEYPKENIIICISTTSKKSGMISSIIYYCAQRAKALFTGRAGLGFFYSG